MAVAFRSNSALNFAQRTNAVLTAPTGIANGDVLIIHFCIGNSSTVPTPAAPAGFTLFSGFPISLVDSGGYGIKNYAWYKIASSESGNYTVTHTTSDIFAYIVAVSGGSGSAPTATTNSGTGTTTTALSITPTTNGAFVMFISQDWGDNTNTLSAPTGSTPTFTIRENQAQIANMFVADGILATAGATGNKTQTNNSFVTSPWSGYLYKVEAPGGAALGSMMGLLGVGP